MSVISHPTSQREQIPLRWPRLTSRVLSRFLLDVYRQGPPPFAGPDADELRRQIIARELEPEREGVRR